VLQTLIGRMVRMAQRDPRSTIEDYVAALWCMINSYPRSRRPVRIAANLSTDTLKAVWEEHRWLRRGAATLLPSSESLEQLLEPVRLDGSPYDSLPPPRGFQLSKTSTKSVQALLTAATLCL